MKLDWKKSCDLLIHIVETKLGHSSVRLVGETLISALPGPSSLKGLLAEKCKKLEAERASEGLHINPSKKNIDDGHPDQQARRNVFWNQKE